MTTRPASLYFAAHAFMYGSSRRLLMQEYVQKLTTTTLPRNTFAFNGTELSQATAPSKSGIRPSSPDPDAIATTPPMRAVAPIQKARRFITKTPDSRARGASPAPVISKNVVSFLRCCVAREPALGVVPLWRRARQGSGLERIGRGVVIEHGITPSAAVREPL